MTELIYVIACGVGNCSAFFRNVNDFHRLVWYNMFVVKSENRELRR